MVWKTLQDASKGGGQDAVQLQKEAVLNERIKTMMVGVQKRLLRRRIKFSLLPFFEVPQ